MDLYVRFNEHEGMGAQIYRRLRDAILAGTLRAGERVPPTRELAERLAVSRNTVAGAYDRLIAEGFLVGRAGAGSFVSADAVATEAPRPPSLPTLQPRPIWKQLVAAPDLSGHAGTPPRFDFGVGTPDPRLFPIDQWRRLVARQARRLASSAARYFEPAGVEALRAAIARYVAVSRSVRAQADDVIVTSGAQQAFDVIARVLGAPGMVAAVEEPGYPPLRQLLVSHGLRVTPVAVDGDGLRVESLPDAARIVYVTPSHQFPLGTAMSLERRLALLAWAERHDAAIIEDDYDAELRFAGRPLEPLQSLDRAGRVLYVGSFSKVLLPSLRLGFVVTPPSLRPALLVAKRLCDWHSEVPTQTALARFIDEGLLARHIRKVTREYRQRRQRILHALAGELAPWLAPVDGSAGLHLTALAHRHVDVARVTALAARAGVACNTIAQFSARAPRRDGLVLGYGAIATAKIDEGLGKLRDCLRAAERRR